MCECVRESVYENVCGSVTVRVCVCDGVGESGLEGSSQPQGGAVGCGLSMLLIHSKLLKITLYHRMFIMIQFYF